VNKFKGTRGLHFVTKVWNLDGQDVISDVISIVVEIAPVHKTRHPKWGAARRSPEYLTEASIPHQVEYMFFSTVAYNKP
jgi:hypothetical protein